MNELKKCSLAGISFTMELTAYEALRTYLDRLEKAYEASAECEEIIADIEAHVAETILSAQPHNEVVGAALIREITERLGTAEHLTKEERRTQNPKARIPRRLYRDDQRARLGGVCAGLGRYFNIDPTWLRIVTFLPLVLSFAGYLPHMSWLMQLMGNLLCVEVVCYLIMWFAVPVAKTARQQLEMNGEPVTAQNILAVATAETTSADSEAKPIVAQTVTTLGKIVLMLLKLLAGGAVFVCILGACALIIACFAYMVGGTDTIIPGQLLPYGFSIWVQILAIIAVLIPCLMMIYVLMCVIASRKPRYRTVMRFCLIWFMAMLACGCTALYEWSHWA